MDRDDRNHSHCIGGLRRSRLLTIFAIGLVLAAHASVAAETSGTPAELRLVGLMHENLALIDRIDEAVVRGNLRPIRQDAAHLKANAKELKLLDLSFFELGAKRGSRFEEYLSAQTNGADAIADAAAGGDGPKVLREVARLFQDACIRCHQDFREANALHKPRVLFMRTLLGSVKNMNRGVAMTDFALVAREARKLETIADIFTWNQVIESMFELEDPADRNDFREHLRRLSTEAIRIESAAAARDASEVSRALSQMLQDGCLACHRQFRKETQSGAQSQGEPSHSQILSLSGPA